MNSAKDLYFTHEAATKTLFSANFGKRPFVFHHKLSNELLSAARLRRLAERKALDPKHRGFLHTGAPHELKWGTEEMREAISESFDQLETSERRIKLSRIHNEPGYAEILAACTAELTDLTSVNLRGAARQPLLTVFVSSPCEVTPYHIDEDENFLFQVQGSKVVYVYDRELFDWRYFENCYSSGSEVIPAGLASCATPFPLRPGLGLHNPVNFPHWVQNGPSVSISVSVAYTRKLDPFGVLRINSRLRKLGLSPTPPGQSNVRDAVKVALFRSSHTFAKLLRVGRSVSPEA